MRGADKGEVWGGEESEQAGDRRAGRSVQNCLIPVHRLLQPQRAQRSAAQQAQQAHTAQRTQRGDQMASPSDSVATNSADAQGALKATCGKQAGAAAEVGLLLGLATQAIGNRAQNWAPPSPTLHSSGGGRGGGGGGYSRGGGGRRTIQKGERADT